MYVLNISSKSSLVLDGENVWESICLGAIFLFFIKWSSICNSNTVFPTRLGPVIKAIKSVSKSAKTDLTIVLCLDCILGINPCQCEFCEITSTIMQRLYTQYSTLSTNTKVNNPICIFC